MEMMVHSSGVASPKLFGGENLGEAKLFDFRRATVFLF